jgi:queuine tRNA-ribosyltransferase
LFTSNGNIKILNSRNKTDFGPADPTCPCLTCKNYSLAYLNHLFKSKEVTGQILATIHNLTYMVELMKAYREKIVNNCL